VLYRILRFINQWYAIAVLWVFVAAFLVALGFMFLFQQVTLALFFFGLVTLGVAVVIAGGLHSIQRMMARRKLDWGVCPLCHFPTQQITHADASAKCTNCGTMYTASGAEIEQSPVMNTSHEDRIV
jgi:hypothetical protein